MCSRFPFRVPSCSNRWQQSDPVDILGSDAVFLPLSNVTNVTHAACVRESICRTKGQFSSSHGQYAAIPCLGIRDLVYASRTGTLERKVWVRRIRNTERVARARIDQFNARSTWIGGCVRIVRIALYGHDNVELLSPLTVLRNVQFGEVHGEMDYAHGRNAKFAGVRCNRAVGIE